MAIYSCNLRSVGKKTHAPGTAGAHLRYIARQAAHPEILCAHMPRDPQQARTWMDQQERADRANARMIDKIRVALPRELNETERAALIREFTAQLTQDRVPWYAAIHQSGNDAHNPHAHIVIRDRDIETGRRVICLSDSPRDWNRAGREGGTPTGWVREIWEDHANLALERAGHEERIDRRTLEAQGIDREPTIHIGPKAQHIDKNVARPSSQERMTANNNIDRASPYAGPNGERVIDYPAIDAAGGGMTRRERNDRIVDLNLERAARDGDERARLWADFERAQRRLDSALEHRLIARDRRRTDQERNLRRKYEQQFQAIRAQRDAAQRGAMERVQAIHRPERTQLKQRHDEDRMGLKESHGRWKARLLRIVDITGRTRRSQQQEQEEQKARHARERKEFMERYRTERDTALRPLSERYRTELDRLNRTRREALQNVRTRHRDERRDDDKQRQAREAAREQQRQNVEKLAREFERAGKERDDQGGRSGGRAFTAFRDAARGKDTSRAGQNRDSDNGDTERSEETASGGGKSRRFSAFRDAANDRGRSSKRDNTRTGKPRPPPRGREPN